MIVAESFFSKTESFVILFLYIFGLQLPIIRTSALLLIFLLPVRFLFSSGIFSSFYHIVSTRYVFRLFLIYIVIIGYALLITLSWGKVDLTLFPTLINIMLHLMIGAMIVSLFVHKNYSSYDILKLLVDIFIAQSVIQLLVFLIPSLNSIVQTFQGENSIEIASRFGGRRGLALAGTVFFGLSSLYGLVFLFFIRQCIVQAKFRFIDIIRGILLLIGGFFTGRTFFIGLGVAAVYFLCSSFSLKSKISILIKITSFIIVSTYLTWLFLPLELQDKVYNLFLYVFEFLFNYFETGTLTTTSSSHLLNDMYFPIPIITFLFGDGLYTGWDGAYYLHTDAGYMRNILFFGVYGLILLILLDLHLLWGNKELQKPDVSKFSFFVLMYLALIQIKGEVFGYLIMLHCFLFIYYISVVTIDADHKEQLA